MESYEQKYKEALGWMKSLYDGLHGKTKEEAEHFFPELKESEDERIRKDIIFFLTRNTLLFGDDINKYKSWIAWLEKQNERPTTISVDKMVDEFEHSKVMSRGIPSLAEVDAYRKGVTDALSKILIREEKDC